MPKLISIVGPTATGKTKTALTLANKLINEKLVTGIDIISVDSRQIYQGLEVLTGADIPSGFSRKKAASDPTSQYDFFTNDKDSIHIYGISIINPNDDWSVAHFQTMARGIMEQSWKSNRLPILVGGTGLYHDQLFTSDRQLYVGPDLEIRQKAEKMTVIELQHWLNKLNNQRFEQMNHSDQFNPRRLIRAIEITLADVVQTDDKTLKPASLTLALTAPLEVIESKIEQRVGIRFKVGAIQEVKNLLAQKQETTSPILSTLGIKEIATYLSGEINEVECQKLWSLHELQYARRQLTWWRRKPDLVWVDVTGKNYQQKVNKFVVSWLATGVEVD